MRTRPVQQLETHPFRQQLVPVLGGQGRPSLRVLRCHHLKALFRGEVPQFFFPRLLLRASHQPPRAPGRQEGISDGKILERRL